MDKQILLGLFLLIGLCIGIYFVYFRHAAPQHILSANRQDTVDLLQVDEHASPSRISELKWAIWAELKNYVVIGDLYDKCDDDGERIQYGKVVILPDKVNGGVMSKTFINMTLSRTVSGGEMYVDCKYNKQELYKSHWDIHTSEDGTGSQVLFFPLQPGKLNIIKDLDIPYFLPKGVYTIKMWTTDQRDTIIFCAFVEFTL